MFLSNESSDSHGIYGNIVLVILRYQKFLFDFDYHDTFDIMINDNIRISPNSIHDINVI